MMKLNVPKRVTLPNLRTFVARYKRIPRDQLPQNIVMRRTYTQRSKRQEAQAKSTNPLVKSVAKQGCKYGSAAYGSLTKKVKNKTLKRILNSDMAHSTLNKAIRTGNNRLR